MAVAAAVVGASRSVAVAVACAALLTISGCAGTPAVDAEPDLTASASRTRDDDNAGGQFQTRVTNSGDGAVTVHSVVLDSPGFDRAETTDREIELGPGSRIDIPTKYGEVRCDAAPTPAYAEVSVTRGDSTTAERVLLDTPYDVLDTIHREQCAANDVAAAVRMTLQPGADVGPALSSTLKVERLAADGDVRIDEVRGSVLYTLSAPLPVTLDAGEASIDIPLAIETATCAAHSIADSKKPFVFPIFVAYGNGDPVYARIPVPIEVQQTLVAYQTRVCR